MFGHVSYIYRERDLYKNVWRVLEVKKIQLPANQFSHQARNIRTRTSNKWIYAAYFFANKLALLHISCTKITLSGVNDYLATSSGHVQPSTIGKCHVIDLAKNNAIKLSYNEKCQSKTTHAVLWFSHWNLHLVWALMTPKGNSIQIQYLFHYDPN